MTTAQLDFRKDVLLEHSGEIFAGLGSFWTGKFEDNAVTKVIVDALQDRFNQAEIGLKEDIATATSIAQAPLHHTEVWYRILLFESLMVEDHPNTPYYQEDTGFFGAGLTFGQGVPVVWSWSTGTLEIDDPVCLANSLKDQTYVAYRNQGFYFSKGTLGLRVNPLTDDRFEIVETENGRAAVLWLRLSKWDKRKIARQYALPLGIPSLPSTESYRMLCEGAWQSRVQGPTNTALYKIISGASGVPLCSRDGEIVEVVTTAPSGDRVVVTNTRAYRFPASHAVTVGVGDIMAEGQEMTNGLKVRHPSSMVSGQEDITLPPGFFSRDAGIKKPIRFPNARVPVAPGGLDIHGNRELTFLLHGDGADLKRYRRAANAAKIYKVFDTRGPSSPTVPSAAQLKTTVNPAVDLVAKHTKPHLILLYGNPAKWPAQAEQQALLFAQADKIVPAHGRLVFQPPTSSKSESSQSFVSSSSSSWSNSRSSQSTSSRSTASSSVSTRSSKSTASTSVSEISTSSGSTRSESTWGTDSSSSESEKSTSSRSPSSLSTASKSSRSTVSLSSKSTRSTDSTSQSISSTSSRSDFSTASTRSTSTSRAQNSTSSISETPSSQSSSESSTKQNRSTSSNSTSSASSSGSTASTRSESTPSSRSTLSKSTVSSKSESTLSLSLQTLVTESTASDQTRSSKSESSKSLSTQSQSSERSTQSPESYSDQTLWIHSMSSDSSQSSDSTTAVPRCGRPLPYRYYVNKVWSSVAFYHTGYNYTMFVRKLVNTTNAPWTVEIVGYSNGYVGGYYPLLFSATPGFEVCNLAATNIGSNFTGSAWIYGAEYTLTVTVPANNFVYVGIRAYDVGSGSLSSTTNVRLTYREAGSSSSLTSNKSAVSESTPQTLSSDTAYGTRSVETASPGTESTRSSRSTASTDSTDSTSQQQRSTSSGSTRSSHSSESSRSPI